MSHQATSLVKTHTFGSTSRKAVALVLADYCDAAWSTFVGQARLAFEAEVGERTVRRILAEFEIEGLITRTRRIGAGGHRTSDRIVLVAAAVRSLPVMVAGDDQPAIDDALPATGASQPATDDRPTGHSLAGYQLEEPSEEPSVELAPMAPKPTRRVDDVWDATLAVCGVDTTSIPSSARGAYNRAVADLKSVGATPDEIRRRGSLLAERWGHDKLTPSSLARHWAEFAGPRRLEVSKSTSQLAAWAEATG